MNEVTYERVKDIDFTSAKKLKENLDIKIDSLDQNKATSRETQPCEAQTAVHSQLASTEEMEKFYEAPYLCETKAVVLNLIDSYAEKFVVKSRNVPVLSDFYDPSFLELDYPGLCAEVCGCQNYVVR